MFLWAGTLERGRFPRCSKRTGLMRPRLSQCQGRVPGSRAMETLVPSARSPHWCSQKSPPVGNSEQMSPPGTTEVMKKILFMLI